VIDQTNRQIQQKNLIWATAVESTLQSREDPLLVYERLLRKYNEGFPVVDYNAATAE
jgi:hypothetical protein